ncbi:MAG: redox-regulated ATPase YchF [Candidatus Methanomethylicaceae archaeon]|nr:redox-regulated ATPase YchF [Candidatus Verstraetearchaeota archaeon]
MISGIIGKTNVGKSTFFSALTLIPVKISNIPFTTIEPNRGIASIRVKCVCKDFSIKDNPRNSICINGIRWVPIEVIDVAGLVPGAHKGKGLGNKFLDDLRQVDGFIHVVDAAGSTDINGNPCEIGKGDPIEDIKFVENEIVMWIFQILKKDWDKILKRIIQTKEDPISVIYERLSGLMIKKKFIASIINQFEKSIEKWSDEDIIEFVRKLRRISKPMVIAANKIDISKAEENLNRIKNEFKEYSIVPCSAEAELLLRLAAKKGIISYMPGDSTFEILKKNELNDKQINALIKVRNLLMSWGSTGVQDAIEVLYRKELKMIAVFPVENTTKLTDHKGNVLPDVILLQEGSTVKDLAYKIHSDLGDKFIFAINVKTGQKIGEDYILKEGDVVKIVAGK